MLAVTRDRPSAGIVSVPPDSLAQIDPEATPELRAMIPLVRGIDAALNGEYLAFRRHAALLQAARATPGQGSIALDGKTLRGSFDRFHDRAAAQVLSAFATDTALVLAQRAVRLEPVPNAFDTLAFVQMQRGETDAARETLESALAKQAGQPTLLYRLGLVRKASGDREGAMNAFRQALEAGVFPESEATRAELASLERSGP